MRNSIFIALCLTAGCLPKKTSFETEVPANETKIEPRTVQSNELSAPGNDCELSTSTLQVQSGTPVTIKAVSVPDVVSLYIGSQALTLPSGEVQVTPDADTEYRAIGLKKGGELASCSILIKVQASPQTTATPTPNPTGNAGSCSLRADTNSIQSGSTAVLTVDAPSNATSIILDGTAIANHGSKFVAPTSTRTYSATFSSPAGQGSCSLTITVVPATNNNNNNYQVPTGVSRFYIRSCTSYAKNGQINSCPVRCNAGNLLVDARAVPEQNVLKHGGQCNWTRLEDGSNGIWCHGSNNSNFTGTAATCTCSISCENFQLN